MTTKPYKSRPYPTKRTDAQRIETLIRMFWFAVKDHKESIEKWGEHHWFTERAYGHREGMRWACQIMTDDRNHVAIPRRFPAPASAGS